jgi:hypothetical protein
LSETGTSRPRQIAFPHFGDARGMLAFLEAGRHVPFDVRGVRWFSAAAASLAGSDESARVLIAIAGSVTIDVNGGAERLSGDSPEIGAYLPAGSDWRIEDATPDAVVVAVHGGDTARPGKSAAESAGPPPPASVSQARVVSLNRLGGDGVAVAREDLEFGIERLYWLYDVPVGQVRGSHAHKALRQLIVAVAGALEVELDDGHSRRSITLERPDEGLFLPPGIWRNLSGFSPGTACLVLASLPYDEADYIRDYPEFIEYRKAASG